MKLFLYDKFWDSFIELPKQVQKATKTFIEKFRANPKGESLHFEHIKNLKDKNLRSVRVDQTYRAIVHQPDRGDIFHLLWVDHHDKAYRWAANKMFQWNEHTNAYQVYETNEVHEVESPKTTDYNIKEEANVSYMESYSQDQLLKIGVPEILIPSVLQINDLDDLEKMQSHLPEDAFENIFTLFDGGNIELLIEQVQEGMQTIDADEEDHSANNQRFFMQITAEDNLDEILSNDFKKWKVFLHPSQRKLVTSDYKGPIKVTGGAGTGKTVAALHRAKFLLSKEVQSKILFTTYTKSLTKHLKKDIKTLGIQPSQLRIENIDSVASDLARSEGVIPFDAKIIYNNSDDYRKLWEEVLEQNLTKYDADFLASEYLDVVLWNNVIDEKTYFRTPRTGRQSRLNRKDRKDVWEIITAYKKYSSSEGYFLKEEVMNKLANYYSEMEIKPFDHILADEIQDFSNAELRFLRSIVKEVANDLFLVGDPLQNIYGKALNFSKCGINIRGNRSKRLKVNYRTTEEIRRMAVGCIKGISFDNFEGEEEEKNGYVSLIKGTKPSYKVFKTPEEEHKDIVHQIVENIKKEELDYKEVCISAYKNDDLKELRKALHKASIPYFELGNNTGDKEGVNVSTFHNMKGLEFKAVFITKISKETYPYKPYSFNDWEQIKQKQFVANQKSLLYVAMTRAIAYLNISGVGERIEEL
ncbi:UvrD-helicase domain-containing protein [Flammeovirga sp. OC4]|uniref:UvrD-helicase domain-containing protein n=1 Tax=Flammeovirga sp. OC4 TaxID=1382345 RepID=UPI0005C6C596|nr:UvrD-helicase domain-containing protein [Flammeovirga sp. OC4]